MRKIRKHISLNDSIPSLTPTFWCSRRNSGTPRKQDTIVVQRRTSIRMRVLNTVLLITRMIQICSFMIMSVCFDRHAARHKAVLVAHLRTAHVLHSKFSNPYASRRRRQAQRILELHRIGRIFIAAHTSDNTPSAMRGKLLKEYRVRKAKAKKPCISALSNKTVCTFHKVGPWQHLQNTVP